MVPRVAAWMFVGQQTSDLKNVYVWENARNSTSLAGVRVTNPNGSAIDVTMTIYSYDGTGPISGDSWEVAASVPSRGTIEVGYPTGTGSGSFSKEVVGSFWFHGFRIESDGGEDFAVHVSFEVHIDVPQSPGDGLTSFWWGVKDPSRTRAIFLFNPNDVFCTVQTESWYWSGGTQIMQTGNRVWNYYFCSVLIFFSKIFFGNHYSK